MSRFVMSSATRRTAQIVAAVVASLALSACGGGSGNTVLEKPGVALYTNAGAEVTVANGSSADFTIGGGGGTSNFVSYSASSSDSKVATVSVEGSKLKITGVTAGEATISVTDSAGASLKITVKVSGNAVGKIAVNAPEQVTLTPGMTSQYKITGGVAPYSVALSNPNVVAASVGKDAVSVTAANPGTSTVVIYDAAGNSSKFEVTVTGAGYGVALYTTAPETLRMTGANSSDFVVNGGLGPYVVTTSDASVVTGSVNGNKLTITSGKVGQGLLNVRDAAGTLVVITVNVTGSTFVPLYTTAPSALTLAAGSKPTYTIEGGIAPFIASSSNADVARATVVDGNKLQIEGITAGVSEIYVFDTKGSLTKVSATVGGGTGTVPLYSTAPDSITVMVGAKPTYQLSGGAAPYMVTNSNVAVATVEQSGTSFTVTGIGAGIAVVAIRDSNGTPLNITVEVR